jgi:FAD/FMN-containing dehydrogenase
VDNTTFTTIPSESWSAFTMRLRGPIVRPGDADYDTAREVLNALYDKKPAAIVYAEDAADVSRCVTFAGQHGLSIAVRGGAHSIGGHSVNNGGIVIDTSRMKNIRVDVENRTAWVQSGCVAREVLAATEPHGFVVPFGDAGSVGVAGITTGGGIGYLTRKIGLTIDNVLAIELVTADGQIVQATETENPDLFWALRGGGGNFGVVTGFQYRLHALPEIYGGAYLVEATPEVLREYARLSLEAPEDFSTISMLMAAPPLPFIPEEKVGTVTLMMLTAYSGPIEKGPEVFAPFRALGEPIADLIGPMPYSGLYVYLEEAEHRARALVRSGFYEDLNDEIIAAALDHAARGPQNINFLQIRPIGNGAMKRVSPEATAFSHRDANFMLAVITHWDEPTGDPENTAWVTSFWDSIKEYREGVYCNFLQAEGEARIREAYSDANFERLAAIKAKYDPTNLLCGNENIAPKPLSAAA